MDVTLGWQLADSKRIPRHEKAAPGKQREIVGVDLAGELDTTTIADIRRLEDEAAAKTKAIMGDAAAVTTKA